MRGFRRRKGAASLVSRFARRREKKRKRRRWRRRIRESERERRTLGDVRIEVLAFILNLTMSNKNSISSDLTYLGTLPRARRLVLISSQSFKLVWAAIKTLKEALIAAPLKSSLVFTREAYLGGVGARLLKACGERDMNHWCRVLYSFALIV